MDGSPTPRSEMASNFAKWSNAYPELWKSRPIKGDIGIVFAPESERFNFAQQGNTANYAASARGAYEAFFDSNIQPDWVHIDNIDEYPVVYLPYPVMLTAKDAGKLRAYVQNGGTLISEGLPAYFGDGAHAGATQPNLGLAEVFGAVEADVDFTPDLLENLKIRVRVMKSADVTSSRSIGQQRVRRSETMPTGLWQPLRTNSEKEEPSWSVHFPGLRISRSRAPKHVRSSSLFSMANSTSR